MSEIKKIRKIMSKKNKSYNNIIIAVFVICLVLMSYGYSLWSEQLQIEGKVSLTQQDTQGGFVPSGGSGDQYVTTDFSTTDAEIASQTVEGNQLTVNYTVKSSTGKPRSTTINIDFQNTSGDAMTNGTATYEITGDAYFIGQTPTITVPSTIEAGGSAQFVIKLSNMKFNNLTTTTTCTITISYTVGTETKEIIVQLNFSR